jgi:hypothetical protein
MYQTNIVQVFKNNILEKTWRETIYFNPLLHQMKIHYSSTANQALGSVVKSKWSLVSSLLFHESYVDLASKLQQFGFENTNDIHHSVQLKHQAKIIGWVIPFKDAQLWFKKDQFVPWCICDLETTLGIVDVYFELKTIRILQNKQLFAMITTQKQEFKQPDYFIQDNTPLDDDFLIWLNTFIR